MKPWCVAAMGETDPMVVDSVEEALRTSFLAPVERLRLPDPGFAFDAARGQYGSVEVLRRLLESRPAGNSRILGITERDLFIPMLTFVFGQAQLDGATAVISLARLRQEYYGMPPDPALLAVRARKEALHECGHMLGLVHCADRRCVMALATGVRALDEKGPGFCHTCSTRADRRRAAAERMEI